MYNVSKYICRKRPTYMILSIYLWLYTAHLKWLKLRIWLCYTSFGRHFVALNYIDIRLIRYLIYINASGILLPSWLCINGNPVNGISHVIYSIRLQFLEYIGTDILTKFWSDHSFYLDSHILFSFAKSGPQRTYLHWTFPSLALSRDRIESISWSSYWVSCGCLSQLSCSRG